MITAFGKVLRKIRIDHNEILKDMADKLNVSSAFLSAVEVGRKSIPNTWCDTIANLYSLNSEEATELKTAADNSARSIKIDLSSSSFAQRNAALAFARRFDDIDDQTAEKILDLMSKSN